MSLKVDPTLPVIYVRCQNIATYASVVIGEVLLRVAHHTDPSAIGIVALYEQDNGRVIPVPLQVLGNPPQLAVAGVRFGAAFQPDNVQSIKLDVWQASDFTSYQSEPTQSYTLAPPDGTLFARLDLKVQP